MKPNSSDFFRTADIWLVGYLLAIGEKYVDIHRTTEGNKRKVYFLFPTDVEVKAHEFFNGGVIPAVQYRNSIQNVKTILFDF